MQRQGKIYCNLDASSVYQAACVGKTFGFGRFGRLL